MDWKDLTASNIVEICCTLHNPDSYVVSPVYYLMTGRKGGRILTLDNKTLIVVKHPNLDNHYLIYPNIIGGENSDLKTELEVAKMMLRQKCGIKVIIARVPAKIACRYKNLIVEEDYMDWKFPVHILDVVDVVNQKGKNFQQIRQRINQLNVHKCRTKEVDVFDDCDVILNMAINWATMFPYEHYSIDDLISPTLKLLELMKDSRLSIYGQIVYYDGVPSAYCLWEQHEGIANGFAMSADRNIPGLAEYNIVEMCRILESRSVSKINMGGAESEGLNRFKKKFSPSDSLNLKSCMVGFT